MQKIKKQPKLIALVVAIVILISLVSTYTLAATTSNSKNNNDAENTGMKSTLEVPVVVEDKVNLVRNGLTTNFKPAIKAVIQVEKETINADIYEEIITSETLKKFGVELGELDYFTQEYSQEEETLMINVVRVTEETIEEKQKIKASVVKLDNPNIYVGRSVTIQPGKNGEKTIVYKVRRENGKETSKVLISETVTKTAIDKIVEVGTKPLPAYTSKYGFRSVDKAEIPAHTKSFVVNASAYDLSYASCGKNPGDRGYGITASGMRARYGVVAVDPKVIPLGTKLYITSLDGSWVYGEAIAGDTGGAIKGNRVDLFFDSHSECLNFGRRQAMVYIIG